MRRCGQYLVRKRFLRRLQKYGKSKAVPYVKIINLPNNPYASSLTGRYVFDITKIPNFNIYFWTTNDDTSKNPYINETIVEEDLTVVNWPDSYKKNTAFGFDQYCTFIGATSKITTNYNDANFVCVLADNLSYLGSCIFPQFLYENPEFFDNKTVLFLGANYTNEENIKEGGEMFITVIHEFGHGFGLGHPHDRGNDSNIMPAITSYSFDYPSIAGYIQNTAFTTVMTYNDALFFLPQKRNFETANIGYASSLLPLDILALQWMYSITKILPSYVTKFGVTNINPTTEQNNMTKTLIGENQALTYGANTNDVTYYFSPQSFTFDNLLPTNVTYNRIIEKDFSFYPSDINFSITRLNLQNKGTAFVFIEGSSLKNNVTINVSCPICNVYFMDPRSSFTIVNNRYTNNKTKRTVVIVKVNGSARINVTFGKG